MIDLVTEMQGILHLGCGRKGRSIPMVVAEASRVISLDADPLLEPDLVCTLGRDPIPLPDNAVDLALAIHVLEHIGQQGRTDDWFFFWEDLYRVLKPGGRLIFESPLYTSVWAWADPQHTRAMSPQALIYFQQDSYRVEGSSITPYRVACDFQIDGCIGVADGNPHIAAEERFSHFRGTMTAIKPLRPWWEDGSHGT